jgi:uncharacterized tellurite resistance protein B-like protein
MSDSAAPTTDSLFRSTLNECRELYVSSGILCARQYPHLIAQPGEKFVQLMDDLHRALVIKVYFEVCEADRHWSAGERALAEELFDHLWGQRLTGEKLQIAARKTAEDTTKLQWYSLIRPFDRIAPLRERIGTLETLVTRLANIVARADGELGPEESAVIRSIQDELQHHLRQIPIDQPIENSQARTVGQQAIETLKSEASNVHAVTRPAQHSATGATAQPAGAMTAPVVTLESALAELDALIGLEPIKQEVRTLTNLLTLRQRRKEAGLPDTEMSLHMVFTGNPGTGKTSVARILGKVFGAMGILSKGHLVETDRSGLVAEYAGQTGPKANAKIGEALGGILFIDEAYSLVAREGPDSYGEEAVQALLKRAEDDRNRLVVILAGYPEEMKTLLASNPGMSSRFNRVLQFDDYAPVPLAQIYGSLCNKDRYQLAAGTRPKLVLGLTEMHRHRDRHFGNGRAVRNLFEQSVRRMANRIAGLPKLSPEQLMLLEEADIDFPDLAPDWLTAYNNHEPKFRIACPGCAHSNVAPGSFLGKKVRCTKCQHEFRAEWGEVVADEPTKTH